LDVQKHPQRLPFSLQASRKRPGCVLPCRVLGEERAEARIPRPPLSHCWPLSTPMTQPLQLGVYPTTTASSTPFHTLCQPFGRTAQRRHAALQSPFPVVLDPRAITHPNTHPVANALRQRDFGTLRMPPASGGRETDAAHSWGSVANPQPGCRVQQEGGEDQAEAGRSRCGLLVSRERISITKWLARPQKNVR